MGWHQSHVLSSAGWESAELLELLERAASCKQALADGKRAQQLQGLSCLTLFYEPSTRTRLSFESACHKLGLGVMSVADAQSSSSAAKGESLEDAARILSAYADAIVIRHPEKGSAARFAAMAGVPVINAGDGAGEHPTQTLVDLFTIQEHFGRLEGLSVGLCGDLVNGRTVHSLARVLAKLGCRLVAIAPPELGLPAELIAALPPDTSLRVEPDLKKALPELDVLYMTRIQKERFADPEAYDRASQVYRLQRADLELATPKLCLLHPLPRVNEIDPDVDADPRARYFTQAANGVPVRMALLSLILGL
ncbi:MAG TPA: aspartate carbamoyltransferase [Candidatus Obscuribacterales bacterium]